MISCDNQELPVLEYDLKGTSYSCSIGNAVASGTITYNFYETYGERLIILDGEVFPAEFSYTLKGDQLSMTFINWTERGQVIDSQINILSNLSYKILILEKVWNQKN